MPVAYRSSSDTGSSVNTNARSIAVPTGATIADIAVVALGQWVNDGSVPVITPPSGFQQKGDFWVSGDGVSKSSVWWKRLTGADSGTYDWSWTVSRYTTTHCTLFSGCINTGDPWFDVSTIAGTFGTFTSQIVASGDGNGGVYWTCYNDNPGIHSPPTNFTQIIENDCAASAYWIPGSSLGPGGKVASGATSSVSGPASAWYGSLIPADPIGDGEGNKNSDAMAAMGRF